MTKGHVFETKAMEQRSLVVFQFTQVAYATFTCPQRPEDRPAALMVSFRLPNGHWNAEPTTKVTA